MSADYVRATRTLVYLGERAWVEAQLRANRVQPGKPRIVSQKLAAIIEPDFATYVPITSDQFQALFPVPGTPVSKADTEPNQQGNPTHDS